MDAIIKFTVKPLLVLAIVLLFVEMVLSNELAGLGKDVSTLDTKAANLTAENQILTQQIASSSSLVTIQAKAKGLGFIEPVNIMALGSEQLPVALRTMR